MELLTLTHLDSEADISLIWRAELSCLWCERNWCVWWWLRGPNSPQPELKEWAMAWETVLPPGPSPGRAPRGPRSLMESLLVAKMERHSLLEEGSAEDPLMLGMLGKRILSRTNSASSMSSSVSSDFCRCDDCLLGIADLCATHDTYLEDPAPKKKVVLSISPLLQFLSI